MKMRMKNFIARNVAWAFYYPFMISFSLLLSSSSPLVARAVEGEEPSSNEKDFIANHPQKMWPLVAFGQNILPEGTCLSYLYVDDFWKSKGYFVDLDAALFYAVSDDFSVMLQVPVSPGYKIDQNKSSGLEDLILQFEYAYYKRNTPSWFEQATLVVSSTFPTGSAVKQPPTGSGALGVFLGGTYNRNYAKWYGFISPGVLFSTSHNGTKYGNVFLYQAGVGRTIGDIGKNWGLAGVAEVDGFYTGKDKINAVLVPNSGNNVIYLTPSLRLYTKGFAFQVGMGVPFVQQIKAGQSRESYYLGGIISWIFN